MKERNKLGIYVHIPFCVRKCRYCDFASAPVGTDYGNYATYFEKLNSEIRAGAKEYSGRFSVDSIFFGGGTPTLPPEEFVCDALAQIRKGFDVCEDAEISAEANPATFGREKLEAFKRAGFNRISMGVQSLNDGVLKAMGRIHTSSEAEASYKLLREYFDNVNIDLIFGTPGQTPEIFEDTLKRALDWGPEHISFYSLQLEEGTPFFEDYRSGRIDLPSWEENREMYHKALELLKASGYVHYEISNAAKPGYECRHNLKYWTFQPYLGFGSAAHSFIDGRRFSPDGEESEELADLKGDFIFTQMRLTAGLDFSLYKSFFSSDFGEEFRVSIEKLGSEGLITGTQKGICFTEKGLDYTNPAIEEFLSHL